MALLIDVNSSRDKNTGFLSNDSMHSFILDGEKWSSVTHYLIAKKFEGTNLQTKIREAPTVYCAKRVARRRINLEQDENGNLKMVKKYCNGIDPNELWKKYEKKYPKLREEALRAKFTQNLSLKKRLLETGISEIIDRNDPTNGVALMKLRKEIKMGKRPNTTKFSYNDLPKNPAPTTKGVNEKVVIQLIFSLLNVVQKQENRKKIYPEMFIDCAYNLYKSSDKRIRVLEYIETITKNPPSMQELQTRAPEFTSLIERVHEHLSKLDPALRYSKAPALVVAQTIRFLSLYPEISKLEVDNDTIISPEFVFWYPPRYRSYRKDCVPTRYTKDEMEIPIFVRKPGPKAEEISFDTKDVKDDKNNSDGKKVENGNDEKEKRKREESDKEKNIEDGTKNDGIKEDDKKDEKENINDKNMNDKNKRDNEDIDNKKDDKNDIDDFNIDEDLDEEDKKLLEKLMNE